jgi:hypothetical protein
MRLAVLAAFLCSCAGIVLPPSNDHPAAVCRVSCSSGRWLSRPQHICVGSTFFEDGRATARVTTRNVDGTVDSDSFVTSAGDFDARDTLTATCQSVIQMRVLTRPPNERGVHPGEQDPLHPDRP